MPRALARVLRGAVAGFARFGDELDSQHASEMEFAGDVLTVLLRPTAMSETPVPLALSRARPYGGSILDTIDTEFKSPKRS